MSDNFYRRRLRYQVGKGGIAKSESVIMSLTQPPQLGFNYVELDYAPKVCALLRPRHVDPVRDMTAEEQRVCEVFLRRVEDDAA
jgi:hypothetical protein